MQLLLQHRASASIQDAEGNTALHFSAAGATRVLRMVLSATADVSTANYAGKTPLMTAARHGKLANCRQLPARGAGRGQHSSSALVAAASYGQEHVVRLLLRNGVAPSTVALAAAASHQHTGVLATLLLADSSPLTAADLDIALVAAAASRHTAGAAMLLGRGALPSRTALAAAAAAGHTDTLELLLAGLPASVLASSYRAAAVAAARA